MSDQSEKLREALDDLTGQLDGLGPLDSEASGVLREALAEIHAALAAEGTPGADAGSPSLVDRLREAAQHFEDEHPTLSGAVGGLIDALGRMGI